MRPPPSEASAHAKRDSHTPPPGDVTQPGKLSDLMTRRSLPPFLMPLIASLYFSGAQTSAITARSARPKAIACGWQH